jgi:hypothetical protein
MTWKKPQHGTTTKVMKHLGEGKGAMALNLILIMPRSTGKWKL